MLGYEPLKAARRRFYLNAVDNNPGSVN